MPLSEFSIIEEIFARSPGRGDVSLGIGDDGAVVRVPNGFELVTVVDTLVAGVHFSESATPFDIAYKSLAVNLSDIAAMGAEPAWATLALTCPHADESWLREFGRGFFELAGEAGVDLVGGDTTRGPLSITVQVQGLVREGGALMRSGASPGDEIYVTGTLGDAAAGLNLLCGRADSGAEDSEYLLERLHRPAPRLSVGRALVGLASACIDVSDGLVSDMGHMARASGVGADIDVDAIPRSNAFNSCYTYGTDDWTRLPLTGGDDYELCFTLSPDRKSGLHEMIPADVLLTRIGRITEGGGVRCLDAAGTVIEVGQTGYRHF